MKYRFAALLILICISIKVYSKGFHQLKTDTVSTDTTFVNQFLKLFAEEEGGKVVEVQRSRRKQVDQLLKSILDRPGKLQFNGVATASLQANLQKTTTYFGVGSFDIFALNSFGDHALLFFDLEAVGGNGPDQFIPTISGLNSDAGRTTSADGIDRLTVLEAWSEFKALREIFTVTFGKIDLTNYFDSNIQANDETSQFITGVFVNNPVLPIGRNSPGIRFRTAFLNRFYIQYGLSTSDSTRIDLMQNHFKILETGFKILPGTGWSSNFRIYGFEHPLAGHSQGFGISFDQLIANHFNLFARFGKNTTGLAQWYGIRKAWSMGIGFNQILLNREFKLGLGFAETFQTDNPEPEQAAEFYLSTQVNKWVFVSPHFQWLRPVTTLENEFFLLGLRLNFIY